MFTRSILIPSMIACAIAAPMMFSKVTKPSGPANVDQLIPASPSGYADAGNSGTFLPRTPVFPSNSEYSLQNASSVVSQNAPLGNPAFQSNQPFGIPPSNPALINQLGSVNSFPTTPNVQIQQAARKTGGSFDSQWPTATAKPDWDRMTPDLGAARTVILPGDAQGPDYSAPPMEFMPVSNFEEVFRFGISPGWIKSRWKRVSTSPDDRDLHGLRVALVTGTNSWDLHGSLTYYFDGKQSLQRITFRGWTGDATQLTNLLTQKYGFKTQPTQYAGFYLAQNKRKPTGGLLMKHPAVIYTENPVQQMALVLEINNPQGKFTLSDDFRSLIVGSQSARYDH